MKRIFGIILCLCAFSACFYHCRARYYLPAETTEYKIIVSTDGPLTAGTKQQFLINAFKKSKTGLKSADLLSLTASLKTKKGVFYSEVRPTANKGQYLAAFQIAGGLNGTSALLTISHNKFAGRKIFSRSFNIKANCALVVLPPQTKVYRGSSLKFKIGVLNKKNAAGIAGAHVLVKIISACAHEVVNRYFKVSSDGTGIFSTQIHKAARPGPYRCLFSIASEAVQITVNVENEVKSNSKALDNANNPQYYSYSQKSVEPASFLRLQNIKTCDEGGYTSFTAYYKCKNTSYRQLELWQNGRLLYSGSLEPSEAFIKLSLPPKNGFNSDCPLQAKLWCLYNGAVYSLCRTIAPEGKSAFAAFFSSQNKLYKSLYGLKTITEANGRELVVNGCPAGIIDKTFNNPLLPLANDAEPVKGSNARFNDTLKIFASCARGGFSFVYDNPKRLVKPTEQIKTNCRLMAVKDELSVCRLDFNKINIYKNKLKFLNMLSNKLGAEGANIDFIVGEAEASMLKINELADSERTTELQRLESLLAPVCEFYDFCLTNPNLKAKWQNRILRLFAYLNKFVYVSSKYVKAALAFNSEELSIGPILPIMPFSISESELNAAVAIPERICLSGQNKSIIIKLDKDINTLCRNTYFNKAPMPKKIINPHSSAVIAEIIFSLEETK